MSLSEASRTAEYMALFRALEEAAPAEKRLFSDPDAVRFLSPRLRAVACAARLPLVHPAITGLIDRRWPGPRPSGVVRTRVIDDFVVSSLAGGCGQLVLLGAGYDTRAWRLPLDPAVTVYEVDHPATQARKREAMESARGLTGSGTDRVRYVPVDFERDSLAAALRHAGLRAELPSCVLWEGVFSYLTPAAIDATLADLAAVCARRSVLLLTYVDPGALNAATQWAAAVRGAGEPFRTALDPADARAFFAARGLTLREDESTRAAALRLGVGGAERIPGFYRLATLELGEGG